MNLGERLRYIRKSKKMTLNKVHEITKISRATLSQWETNKVPPSMTGLERWAKGLGIEVWDIFFPPSEFELSSDEEIQLLEMYRQLSPQNQSNIFNLLKSLSKRKE